MAVFASEQVEFSNPKRTDVDLYPADSGGKLRSCYFKWEAKTPVAKGDKISLGSLIPGTIRIHGGISDVVVKGKFSFGYGDYRGKDGDAVVENPVAFDKEIENGKLFTNLGFRTKLYRTQTGVHLLATAKAAMKTGASIEGVVYYTGN